MNLKNFELAQKYNDEIKELNVIIQNIEMDTNSCFEFKDVCITNNYIRINECLTDDIIRVIKNRRDKLIELFNGL